MGELRTFCYQAAAWQRAMELFDAMGHAKVELDTSSYSAAINARQKG